MAVAVAGRVVGIAGWPAGRMAGWPWPVVGCVVGGWVSGCPGVVRVAGCCPGGRVLSGCWPGGRVLSGWPSVVRVAGCCPGGRVLSGWPGVVRVAGCCPGGRVLSGWPGVGRVVAGWWPGGLAAAGRPGGWPGGRVAGALAAVCHPLAYQEACLFVHFGEFTHTHQCQFYTQARSKAASLRGKRRASSVADAHATDEPVA